MDAHTQDQHEAQRARFAARRLERDLARLLPRVGPEDRTDAVTLVDAARAGHLPIGQAHQIIRDRIAEQDQQAA